LKEFVTLVLEAPAKGCNCKRCELERDMQAAREDETLGSQERVELMQDLRADLARAPRCPKSPEAPDARTKRAVVRALEEYMERPIDEASVFPDPRITGTYAVRVEVAGSTIDFLVRGVDSGEPIDPWSQVEEVEFETWPPRSRR